MGSFSMECSTLTQSIGPKEHVKCLIEKKQLMGQKKAHSQTAPTEQNRQASSISEEVYVLKHTFCQFKWPIS